MIYKMIDNCASNDGSIRTGIRIGNYYYYISAIAGKNNFNMAYKSISKQLASFLKLPEDSLLTYDDIECEIVKYCNDNNLLLSITNGNIITIDSKLSLLFGIQPGTQISVNNHLYTYIFQHMLYNLIMKFFTIQSPTAPITLCGSIFY